ncbi:MAG TPA: asparagine synthase (glutamine-hydrolyzing) [Sphingomicrobium sp.]|nr:asparagine synthase (glutamine-hydrolyzing) [Sphingomicrobium sp.]
MCGIAGWYRRGAKPVPEGALVVACDRLRRRGPDDAGYFIDGDFGFGMRRLSIIDVDGGHQPIFSPEGHYAIIFNGEIVNHPALRRELESGYAFKTDHSDTETILAAFLRWGDDAWLRLEGMYAVAIWDRLARTLTLARDAVGIKPLYFTEQRGGLAFASEITALRELPDHEFDLDENGVDDFFCFGHTLPPRTIYREVRPLEPGHVLHIGESGEAEVRPFWKARLNVEQGVSEQEWIDRTRSELLRTVQEHQLSDVPIGAFVSGGVDSGAIAAAMVRTSSAPFKIFTAGFPGSARDETAAARRIADHLGCEHVVLPMQPQTAADVLPAVQASFDEPTAANSAVPLWYLSRAAAEHVKVVLCGEGGDELFLGYNRQRWARRMARWQVLGRVAGGALAALPQLPVRQWNYMRQLGSRFREGALLNDGYERFFAAVSISTPEIRSRIYNQSFFDREQQSDSIKQRALDYFPTADRQPLSDLEQFMMGDLTVHMPASMCQRLDRSSMAHSLEARVPFLSHRFVDYALTIPTDLKLRGNVGKYVLRKAVEPWLPPRQLDQRKIGFQLPLADWFMGGFNDFAREIWTSSGASKLGLLDSKGVDRLFDEHRRGGADHGRMLYAIAMFSCWWEQQKSPATESSFPGKRESGFSSEKQMRVAGPPFSRG